MFKFIFYFFDCANRFTKEYTNENNEIKLTMSGVLICPGCNLSILYVHIFVIPYVHFVSSADDLSNIFDDGDVIT